MDNHSINQERSSNCTHEVFNSGCGCNDTSGMVITISPTTGGQFNLQVRKTDSIDHLKKIISKKLKVLRERICLLYRDKQLTNGSLQENELTDGCRLTLLPIVETGLTTQRPELSVMNALESLNESQVNDFLSGKAPLNLTMRLGDHMMLIQLMLSTFSNQNQMSVSNATPKTDEYPSTSAFASCSKSTEKEPANKPESSIKPTVSVENTATSSTLTTSRLEKILISRSSSNVAGTKLDLSSVDEVPQEQASSSFPVVDKQTKIPSEFPACTSTCSSTSCTCRVSSCSTSLSYGLDSVPLAKATRNLTQTLQKLSSEVLTSKRAAPAHSKYKSSNDSIMHFNRKPTAILENMEHHGRGIYSGTFSGTLNPALQDRFGRPKKDVSTIIHILNDLLCAEPRTACKTSCSCSPSLVAEKIAAASASSIANAASFTVPERTLKTVDENTICNTATVIPMNAGEKTANLFNKMSENQTTRSKMEQLKSIMGERKEKRKEKRFSPYEKRISSVNLISSSTVNASEAWLAANADTGVHPSEPIDADSSIHSEAVIA